MKMSLILKQYSSNILPLDNMMDKQEKSVLRRKEMLLSQRLKMSDKELALFKQHGLIDRDMEYFIKVGLLV